MAKKNKSEEQELKAGLPHSQEKVIVIGTESSPFLKTGKEYEVTETSAVILVKKGQATLK
jgi:hypothetical protein